MPEEPLREAVDLRAEAEELAGFLAALEPALWGRPTAFLGWTPWDVVAHLHYFDEVSLASLEGREAFAARRDDLGARYGRRQSNAEIAREAYGELTPAALLDRWQEGCRCLAEQLAASDPKRRLPWFGPDMGVRMFTTARLMETWAHGQEVYDLAGAARPASDRIRHIAVIGVKTFGWTFANRGLEPPGPPPYVRLEAPSGAVWEFGEPSDASRVAGRAVDFCRVVTQTRNVADTPLEVVGDVARQWLAIAQCFAGPPADPPRPGVRTGPHD